MPDDMVSGGKRSLRAQRACLACNEAVDHRSSHTFPLRLGE